MIFWRCFLENQYYMHVAIVNNVSAWCYILQDKLYPYQDILISRCHSMKFRSNRLIILYYYGIFRNGKKGSIKVSVHMNNQVCYCKTSTAICGFYFNLKQKKHFTLTKSTYSQNQISTRSQKCILYFIYMPKKQFMCKHFYQCLRSYKQNN